MNKTSGGMHQFTMLSLGTSHQLRGGGLGATKWYGGVAKRRGGGGGTSFSHLEGEAQHVLRSFLTFYKPRGA